MSAVEFTGLQCPIPISEYPYITLAHGGGGRSRGRATDAHTRIGGQREALELFHPLDLALVPGIPRAALLVDPVRRTARRRNFGMAVNKTMRTRMEPKIHAA